MGVRLVNKTASHFAAHQLADGQLAVVTEGGAYQGRIVQRVGEGIITVGGGTANRFHGNNSLTVRLLEKGEFLVVT